jgi:quinol monooxygenase YgiN
VTLREPAAPKRTHLLLPLLLFVLENVFGYYAGMLIVHVHVHVKPECVTAFQAATHLNARLSRLETGVLTFDVLQQADAPERFVLIEIYRDPAAAAAHKESAHYPVWRDTVAELMAEPRHSVKFNQVD